MLWIATAVVTSACFGAYAALALRRRRRRPAAIDERARAAFERARVDVFGVKRLSLADVDRVEPGDPELPYVFYLDVSVAPAAEVAWTPSDLEIVSDQSDAPDHGKADFELVRIRVDTAAHAHGARRLEVTVRSRRSTPAYHFLYHGVLFGRVKTFSTMIISTHSSLTALSVRRASVEPPTVDEMAALDLHPPSGDESEFTHPAVRAARAREAADFSPPAARFDTSAEPEPDLELTTISPAPPRDAEVAYAVYSPTGDAFEVPPIDGLDTAAFAPLARATAPERFDLATLVGASDAPVPKLLIGAFEQAQFVYQVIVRRPAADLSHLASALTTAASIAIACRGVIIDMVTGQWLTAAVARTVLKSTDFSIMDHVSVQATATPMGQTLRTRGLVKFGCAECIALDVPTEHVGPVRDAMLAIANHRSLGGSIDAGVTLKIGAGYMSLVPGRDGDLILSDASPQPGSPRGVLKEWLAASTVPPAKSATA